MAAQQKKPLDATAVSAAVSVVLGLLLIWVSLRPVRVSARYGNWNRYIR